MAKQFGNPETMKFVSASSMLLIFFFFTATVRAVESNETSPFVYRDFMEVARTDAGVIRSLRITNVVHGRYDRGPIDLSFITMELSSLLLPLFLNRDYVLYVHTGKARLGLVWKNKLFERDLKVGDIYRVPAGFVFYVFNTGDAERLRLIGIMERPKSDAHFMEGDESQMIFVGGGYGNPASVLSGFDPEILRSAFKVSAEEIKELLSGKNYGPIVHSVPPKHKSLIEDRVKGYILSTKNVLGAMLGGHKKKMKVFNILNKKPSFHNKYGWTKVVNRKDYSPLKYSDLNIFMVNLTKGTMLSPHWNPRATEIGFVTRGGGMVQIVYPNGSSAESIRVSQGDVFIVPQFYPMSQLSFGNGSFEFLGFSTCSRYNRPQFLAGENSVLNILHKDTAALGFGVSSDYLADMLDAQRDAVIFTCPSCAERLEDKMEREKERREEEKRKREEEERKKKEEEERKKKEEEERKKREEEEEERKKREDEERKKREEEEEEERKKREEEEERKKREEEEEERRKREEEEERKKREEEEEERKKREEEEERRKGEEEEEEEEERRKEEERKKKEEEEKGRKEEERRRREKEEEEEERRKREGEEEEEERRKREEERRKREEEEERREEEEREKRGEEEEREEKEREKRREEEGRREEERRKEEERKDRREEEERRVKEKKKRKEVAGRREEGEERKEVAGRREEGEERKRERRDAHEEEKEKEKGQEEVRKEKQERKRNSIEAQEEEEEEREKGTEGERERERRNEQEMVKEEVERGGPDTQVPNIQLDVKMVPRRLLHALHS